MKHSIRTLLVLFFFINHSNLFSQQSDIDSIYIRLKDDYKIDAETDSAFQYDYKSWGTTGNEDSKTQYYLYKCSHYWHYRRDEEYFGLIHLKCDSCEPFYLSRQHLLKSRVRELIDVYQMMLSSNWKRKYYLGKLRFFVIKESEFTNDSILNLEVHSAKALFINSIE